MPDPPVVLDPYAYEFHDDPYPTYARLRAEAPLYHNEEREFWALSRHAEEACLEPELWLPWNYRQTLPAPI